MARSQVLEDHIGSFIRDLVMGYNRTIGGWPNKVATMSFMRTDPYVNYPGVDDDSPGPLDFLLSSREE